MLRQSRVLGSHLGQGHSFTYGRAKEGQSQQIRRYYLLGLAVQSRGSQGLVGNYSRLLRGQRQSTYTKYYLHNYIHNCLISAT
jgi:hypothetical protein